jgi:hypothetical protein
MGAGCQTFRASESERDKARDEQVGRKVEAMGMTLHWALQMMPWIF